MTAAKHFKLTFLDPHSFNTSLTLWTAEGFCCGVAGFGTICCGVADCGTICCGVADCGAICCGVADCGTICCGVAGCGTFCCCTWKLTVSV